MNRTTRLTTMIALLALPLPALAAPIHAVLYKNPQCACCDDYVAALQQSGFEVDVKQTDDLDQVSLDAGVPEQLEGCHVMVVDGYVVDGLVPIDIVKKLLSERPAIAGITLPGMPTGAIGMPGSKTRPFTIHAFTKDGKAPTVYAVE